MHRKSDVPQGTLALMVLKTHDLIGPLDGYGIARRIEQISSDLLAVNQGALYPLLLKLEHEARSPLIGRLGEQLPRAFLSPHEGGPQAIADRNP